MNLVKALEILDGNSRVLCPQIACEEARGIAEVLRDTADELKAAQENVDFWFGGHDQQSERADLAEAKLTVAIKERDEARAEVEMLRANYSEASTPRESTKSPQNIPGNIPNIGRQLCAVCNQLTTRYSDRPHYCSVCAAPDFDASDYERPGKVKP